jgi:hypothetical protein
VRGNICNKARNGIAGERRKDPCFEIALLSRKAPPIKHLLYRLVVLIHQRWANIPIAELTKNENNSENNSVATRNI